MANETQHVWWIERGKLGIARKSDTDTGSDYLSPSEVKQLNIFAITYDEDFVKTEVLGQGIEEDESPAIPEEFHEILSYYAIARGYEKRADGLQQAQYFRRLFDLGINNGKKYANKGKDGSAYSIKYYDY